MGDQPHPKHNWPMQAYRVLGVIHNQVRSLRKRQLIDGFNAGLREGAYWGVRSDIADYDLPTSLPCPVDATMKLARVSTRLAALKPRSQEQLINWGYAISDTALRKHVAPGLDPPPGFPYPDAGDRVTAPACMRLAVAAGWRAPAVYETSNRPQFRGLLCPDGIGCDDAEAKLVRSLGGNVPGNARERVQVDPGQLGLDETDRLSGWRDDRDGDAGEAGVVVYRVAQVGRLPAATDGGDANASGERTSRHVSARARVSARTAALPIRRADRRWSHAGGRA